MCRYLIQCGADVDHIGSVEAVTGDPEMYVRLGCPCALCCGRLESSVNQILTNTCDV
jgi:hypothetical protein